VRIRNVVPLFALAVICLGQGTWQTATDLPGVDWHGLAGAKKTAALKFLREESCACGCNMKLAECRMGDPTCAVSRKLAGVVTKDFAEGKTAAAVRADVKRVADEPPPILDEPVQISTAGDPSIGPANAKMTIVEFSDFQCPYCSKVVPATKEIVKAFPKDVRFVFKQFPLDTHADAEFGAEAALAAQSQGKFWEMHDRLYAGFPDLSRKTVMRYAREIGLNLNKFEYDVDKHTFAVRVKSEEQEGEVAGVAGTPTFFFNGKRYNGQFDVASVAPLLKKEMK
jgi:protein-disulfide isomerase